MHSLERRREIEQVGWGEFSYNILEERQADRFIDREPLGDLCELLEAELCVVYEGIDIEGQGTVGVITYLRTDSTRVSDEAAAQKAMKAVMNIETRLAKSARSMVELRDPHANYNKKTMADVKKEYAPFARDVFFSTLGVNNLEEVNIGQPASLKAAADILDTLPIEQQSLYLQWKLIDSAASLLNDAMAEQNFDFYSRTMSGTQEMQPRWKRAVSTVSSALGEAVGQMYVEKYFPAAAK